MAFALVPFPRPKPVGSISLDTGSTASNGLARLGKNTPFNKLVELARPGYGPFPCPVPPGMLELLEEPAGVFPFKGGHQFDGLCHCGQYTGSVKYIYFPLGSYSCSSGAALPPSFKRPGGLFKGFMVGTKMHHDGGRGQRANGRGQMAAGGRRLTADDGATALLKLAFPPVHILKVPMPAPPPEGCTPQIRG